MVVMIYFLFDDVMVVVWVGELILDVVERVGVFIFMGCLMGFCYVCEVELGDGIFICVCISVVLVGV